MVEQALRNRGEDVKGGASPWRSFVQMTLALGKTASRATQDWRKAA